MKALELDHAAVVTGLKNYVFIYIMWKAGCVHYGKKVNWLTAMFCLETFVLEMMQMFLLHVPLTVISTDQVHRFMARVFPNSSGLFQQHNALCHNGNATRNAKRTMTNSSWC